jgi:hypothetical protein
MRGGGETGCDVGGKQAAVCVHVNTQGGSLFVLFALLVWFDR